MVCLKGCMICGISVLDDDLCPDCMRAVSDAAMKGEKINKEKIKKMAINKRMKEDQRELKEHLKALHTCPSCHRKI